MNNIKWVENNFSKFKKFEYHLKKSILSNIIRNTIDQFGIRHYGQRKDVVYMLTDPDFYSVADIIAMANSKRLLSREVYDICKYYL